jgi:predicted  nucleic acid-binding Zn-ribbon protein
MDVKDYCQAMESEITSWKAKLYDVMRKIENLGTAERQKMLGNIQDLNIYLDEMTSRVDQLRNECPTEWSPIKNEVEKGTVDMRGKYEETLEAIGKAAPVSIPG